MPTHILQDALRFIGAHTTNTQRSNLRSSPKSLQTDGHFPTLFFLQHKDISFAFQIPDISSKDMEAFRLAALWKSTTVRLVSQRGCSGPKLCQLAATIESSKKFLRFLVGRHRCTSLAKKSRCASGRGGARTCSQCMQVGTPYLDQLQSPCLDIPFSLRYTPHIIVNEKSLGRDS